MIVIIGGGLAGLSASYHIGHERCLVLEKEARLYGHIGSDTAFGLTWDRGPHVSFTKNEYVRTLFAQNVNGEYDEYPVKVGNYFKGHWIDHPAQTSLHQVPDPIRTRCLESFLSSRSEVEATRVRPSHYMQWLEHSFGPEFARTFPAAYTRKYWTVDATELTTDWVGNRILLPRVKDVVDGARASLNRNMHYINMVRYPRRGGYEAFARKLAEGCNIRLAAEVAVIDLRQKELWLANGERIHYTILVNTMPLPLFIRACRDVPADVMDAAFALSCSQLMLIDIASLGEAARPENWIYVYDEEFQSTRIHFTEKLTVGNGKPGWSGIQTEVYFSRHKPLLHSPEHLKSVVVDELIQMGLLSARAKDDLVRGSARCRVRYSPWANIIFHHQTRAALDVILSWLERYGLKRSEYDTHPLTDWSGSRSRASEKSRGSLTMAGRFGQWKYYWSDDCVLRGREIASTMESN